jgi:hypothetical protein
MEGIGVPVPVQWLSLAAMTLGALAVIWRKGLKPALTVTKLLIHRWEDLGRVVVIAATVDEIKTKVEGIERDIAPSNGDQRGISDRLDTVRHNVQQMKDDQHLARDDMFELRRAQDAISDDVQTIRERQEQHRETTELTAKQLRRHDLVDERNFGALAQWSTQFRHFEPITFEPYDSDPTEEVADD